MTMTVSIREPRPENPKFSIFSYGFRPFFLLAGIYAIVPLLPWILLLTGYWYPPADINMEAWHAHEMVYGFAGAAICGFLLTAVPNWTGLQPVQGRVLKALVAAWLLGRMIFWLALFDLLPHPRLLYLSPLHVPMLGYFVMLSLTASRNRRNYIFLALLIVLCGAELFIIQDVMNDTGIPVHESVVILATNIIMVMIGIVGGRIVPEFTRAALHREGITHHIRTFRRLEIPAIALLLLVAFADLIAPQSPITATIALFAALIHIVRFSFWESRKTLYEPILWVLHLGYLWLIITLLFKGTWIWLELPHDLAVHALTVGAMGTFIIGVMSRAALGHTGRILKTHPIITPAYLLVSLAALTRLLIPLFWSQYFGYGMALAALFWSGAFLLFTIIYAPILMRPRADGLPG